MSKVNGLAAIVEDEAPTDRPPADAPVQLALDVAFRPLTVIPGAAGPIVPAPDDSGDSEVIVQGERRSGRPPGARNKSTEAWRRFILAGNGSPLQALARVWSRDPKELAQYLGCTPLEALGKIHEAARISLPYLHSPMPTDVRVDNKGAFGFVVMTGGRPDGGRGDIQTDDIDPLVALERLAQLAPATIEQYQGLSGQPPGESNGSESNTGEKSEADQ